jgi:hypothetical protein
MVFGTVVRDQIRPHGHRAIDHLPNGAAIDPSTLPGASTVTMIKAAAAGCDDLSFRGEPSASAPATERPNVGSYG